ncbi:carboxyl-terminal protease [Thalassoporum mexicanum PCC 7367]|uniref:carboxyl-terminal processing protease CtpC n=1 Tax=Thalassoporum mexicanum TaxID=3457544 RepID=UPI00029FBB3D|nr:carboxyl-terminal processing protease CtpC [Pseudanabaena sp. PCC 7367]AFY71000.1 carboxyl-terminal protease [Pseudanabaena sp. PCC 7367]
MAKRGLILSTTAALASAVAVVGFQLATPSIAAFRNSPKEVVDEVWQIINRDYVDGTFNQVDWQQTRNEYLNREYASKNEAYLAVREMLETLDDPYTRFMDPDQFKSMQIDTSGELTGVGIQLGLDEETERLTIIAPIDGSPAAKEGLIAKDMIVTIEGKNTEGMDLNEAVNLIRGPIGTKITLGIQRGSRVFDVELKRAKIELHPVTTDVRQTNQIGKVGYIRLTQFNANATSDMRKAILELEDEDVNGFILDLRSNPGGLLYSSAEIARMWIDNATIVSTVDREGENERLSANRQSLTKKPLVVLVDGGSASASEILSGALQDNGRAIIVGTKTFGKGLVQSVHTLGDGSGLAVTIAKYYTPKGTDINHEGIVPDVVIELTDSDKERLIEDRDKIGTIEDPQYAKALEILTQQVINPQTPSVSFN